jgi:hypothetical protein
MKHVENAVDKTAIFQVIDVSCLENNVSEAGCMVFESKLVQENDPFA